MCVRLPPDCSDNVAMILRRPISDTAEYCLVYEHAGDDAGDDETRTHYLHVELATNEFFDDGPPRRKGSKRAFDRIIAKLSGVEAMAHVTGRFRLPMTAISPAGFVQMKPQFVSIPGVQCSYRGASIELNGLPVHRVDWRVCPGAIDDESEVEIRIFGSLLLSLSDNYLVEALNFLEFGLLIVVSGEINDIED